MDIQAERARLNRDRQRRSKAWDDFKDALVDYAARVAPNTNSFAKLTGNKHAPRVRLDLHNCFEKLLPHVTLKSQRHGHFTCAKVYERFQDEMLAAGVDIKGGHPIVSVRQVALTITRFRMTGETVPFASFEATKMRRILKRREAEWRRLNRVELEAYKTQRAAAKCQPPAPTIPNFP